MTVANLVVPTQVFCIRVAASLDSITTWRLFSVTGGQGANLQIVGLVPGDYIFTGYASSDACPSDPSAMENITHTTEPTPVVVNKGQTTHVTLVFDPVPPPVEGIVDFEIPVMQAAGQDNRFYWIIEGQVFGSGKGALLGDGTNLDRNRPVPIPSLSGSGVLGKVVEIATGRGHICARRVNGTIWCLGSNNMGQLGNGTRTDSPAAVQVSLPLASQIAAANDQTCAVSTDYKLYCWGNCTDGQCGSDFGLMPINSPILVTPEGSLVYGVAMGRKHTCVINTRGSVYCAGSNAEGQLGNDRARSFGWFRASVEAISDLWAGENTTCTGRADGEVSCWGAGPIGLADTPTGSRVPVVVPGLTGAQSIALGNGFGCASFPESPPKCWGTGLGTILGALGDGTGETHFSPTPVMGMGEAALVAVGGSTVYAVQPTGAAYGWGDNVYGQLGFGDLLNRFVPERLLFCDPNVPSTCTH